MEPYWRHHVYCLSKETVTEETVFDATYADDLALLANTAYQAESLLHSLEQAAEGICLLVTPNKTESMYFKQERAIASKISLQFYIPE